jgi:hypothetical protein
MVNVVNIMVMAFMMKTLDNNVIVTMMVMIMFFNLEHCVIV